MRKCVRCNRVVVLGDLCRLCEFEFRQKVKKMRVEFKKEFTKRDQLERFTRLNPEIMEELRELGKRIQ